MNYSAWKLSRKTCRYLSLIATAVGFLVAVHGASAQLGNDQGVWNSVPMYNAFGVVLPGSNPAQSNECTVVPGCLVEILGDGSNNVAHVANPDGSPSGGDTILFTTFVGQGDLCGTLGQFSTSFYPPPPSGTKIYGRVFNAPSVGQASYWGQSADFTTDGSSVMDLSALGMEITTMPMGVNLSTVDSKGVTYLEELVANTNPQNPDDGFQANGITMQASEQGVELSEDGKAGRQYTLQRTTNQLSAAMVTWTNISSTAVLSSNASLVLTDLSPPKTSYAFYRIMITMP
jgi:hypothetical protein